MSVRSIFAMIATLLAACSGAGEPTATSAGAVKQPPRVRRDVRELERIKEAPVACRADAACPVGSHCGATGTCAWSCLADSDCGDAGGTCSMLGRCEPHSSPGVIANVSDDTSGCAAIPAATRHAALLALAASDDPPTCADDSICICGAYCGGEGVCRVDCLASDPTPELTCGSGMACTPLGRCAPRATDPGPPPHLTIAASPVVASANTVVQAVVVPVAVTLDADSLVFVQANHPAVVTFHVVTEIVDDPDAPPPGPAPRVKCASDGALDDHCEIHGGWTFDIVSHTLHSAPRTLWIEIPQVAANQRWTIDARSEWATGPTAVIAESTSGSSSSTDPGSYTGTLGWPGAPSARQPITAIVSASHIALYDPSRVVFPDGHAVLPRPAAAGTPDAVLLPWLSSALASGTETYQALARLGPTTYTPATGQLTGNLALTTNGTRTFTMPLALIRTGDLDAPTCTATPDCAAGRYCDAAMQRCLPGTGGVGQQVVTPVAPSTALRSSAIDTWSPAVSALTGVAGLSGTGIIGFERAYCFQDPSLTEPGRFSSWVNPDQAGTALLEPSLDRGCYKDSAASVRYAQPTFGFENRTKEVDAAGTFNLLQQCSDDLNALPTAPLTLANLMPQRPCASLARFYMALSKGANAGYGIFELDGMPPVTRSFVGQRLVIQLLRQWLNLNAFVATSTLQTRGYDDALGAVAVPAVDRLGAAVDHMEQNLGVLLDPAVRSQFAGNTDEVTASPDYRAVPRPTAYWNFNDNANPSVNLEGGPGFAVSGAGVTVQNSLRVADTAPSTATAQTTGPIALADRQFSIVMSAGFFPLAGTFTVLAKDGPDGHQLRVDVSAVNSQFQIALRDSVNGVLADEVTFTGLGGELNMASMGTIAIVADNGTYRLYQRIHQVPWFTINPFRMLSPASQTGQPHWGSAGPVRLATGPGSATLNHQFGSWFFYDDLSLWSRAISAEEVEVMDQRSSLAGGAMLPPKLALTGEQTAGLAVHLVEATGAQLELLGEYLDAERAVIYPDCSRNRPSAAMTRALDRVGRHLRLASVLEGEAALIAASPAAAQAAWLPRYQGAVTALTARRNQVLSVLDQIRRCDNPLGIADEELPLFVGNAGSAIEKYFSGSRFLAAQARSEVDSASRALDAARSAYNAQRTSDFQVALAVTDKAARINAISVNYEGQLRRYCGSPPGDEAGDETGTPRHVLLDGFATGAFTADNCFFKTERPECLNAASLVLESVPSTCLRGEIGERLLSIQSAAIDASNAWNSFNRATALFDSDMEYCGKRQEAADEDNQILAAHHRHMAGLHELQRNVGLFFNFEKSLSKLASGDIMGGIAGVTDVAIGAIMGSIDASIESEQSSYEEEVQKRKGDADVLECYHKVDNEKFAIDAARDVIRRAAQDTQVAQFHLVDAKTTLAAVAAEAKGQLVIESRIDRVPPQLHFWVADTIAIYQHHLTRARRLSYLALRSLEHETQQSLGRRGDVLTARNPSELLPAVEYIEDRTAPFEGAFGTIGPHKLILGLRDEILQVPDLAHNTHLEPGQPPLSPEEGLRAYLASDASKIFSSAGGLLGHGVRFSLRPGMGFNLTSCGERLWRVTPSVLIDGALDQHQLVLLQANAFSSQTCSAATGVPPAEPLIVSRWRPSQSLFGADTAFDFVAPSPFTAMNIDGPKGQTREQLEAAPEGDAAGLAERGLYGEYILLFPSSPDGTQGFTTEVLSRIKDVLLRFDTVEVTNVHL